MLDTVLTMIDRVNKKALGHSDRRGILPIKLLHIFPTDKSAEHWQTCLRWSDRVVSLQLRETMVAKDPLFDGPLEADESHVIGLETSKHADNLMKAAGGSLGEAIVACVRDRATSRVAAKVVLGTTSDSLVGLVLDHTERGVLVLTDETKGDLLLEKRYGHRTFKQLVAPGLHAKGRCADHNDLLVSSGP